MSSASMVTQMWSVNSVTTLHSTLGLLLESGTNENTEIGFVRSYLKKQTKKPKKINFSKHIDVELVRPLVSYILENIMQLNGIISSLLF